MPVQVPCATRQSQQLPKPCPELHQPCIRSMNGCSCSCLQVQGTADLWWGGCSTRPSLTEQALLGCGSLLKLHLLGCRRWVQRQGRGLPVSHQQQLSLYTTAYAHLQQRAWMCSCAGCGHDSRSRMFIMYPRGGTDTIPELQQA